MEDGHQLQEDGSLKPANVWTTLQLDSRKMMRKQLQILLFSI